MRFYGWSWEELMTTPIRAFWTCLKGMNRLRAAENKRLANIVALPNIADADRKAWFEAQDDAIGTVVVATPVRDEEGVKKLKKLAGAK
jgi:hypothetical protein